MNTFGVYAAATAGIIIPLVFLPLIAYLIFIIIDLSVWWLKVMKQHKLEEKAKQPPYDEAVITELKHSGIFYIDLKRDEAVVWSGRSDLLDIENSRFRVIRRFSQK